MIKIDIPIQVPHQRRRIVMVTNLKTSRRRFRAGIEGIAVVKNAAADPKHVPEGVPVQNSRGVLKI